MDTWSACFARLASNDTPAVADWPEAGRRRIRCEPLGEREAGAEPQTCTTDEQALAVMMAAGSMTTLQLSLALNCSLTTAYKRMRRLRDSGALVDRRGPPAAARPLDTPTKH